MTEFIYILSCNCESSKNSPQVFGLVLNSIIPYTHRLCKWGNTGHYFSCLGGNPYYSTLLSQKETQWSQKASYICINRNRYLMFYTPFPRSMHTYPHLTSKPAISLSNLNIENILCLITLFLLY